MKQVSVVIPFLLLMSLASRATFGQSSTPSLHPDPQKIQKQVSSAEREWLDAVYRLDATAVDRSESNELTIIARGATATKQEHIAAMRARQTDTATRKQPSTRYILTNQKISVYDNIAVVTDVASVMTSDQNPITMSGQYWQTEIWRNEAGTWKLIHLHASPIPRHK